MRAYELMVILDPDLEERTVQPSLDTYLNVVRKDGGSVENIDIWGRRRLAYEIDKNAEGIYAVVTLQAEPATVKELDRQAGRGQRPGNAHANGDIGLEHLVGKELAAFLQARGVVGQKDIVHHVRQLLFARQVLGQDALAGHVLVLVRAALLLHPFRQFGNIFPGPHAAFVLF